MEDIVTHEQYTKLIRYVKKELKRLEGLIDDSFESISNLDDRLTQNVDEAIEKSNRAQRAIRRLQKEIENGS